MAINKFYFDEEKIRGIEELERLEKKHQDHYKVVKAKREGIALGLALTFAFGMGAAAYGRSHVNIGTKGTEINRMVEDQKIDMVRSYTIKFGDTLTSLSKQTGIPIKDIQEDNGIENKDLIRVNGVIYLKYRVNEDDLKYYTNTITVAGRPLNEIAVEYGTDVATLCRINKDYIKTNPDGTHTINNASIKVPNFITPEELKKLKDGYQK